MITVRAKLPDFGADDVFGDSCSFFNSLLRALDNLHLPEIKQGNAFPLGGSGFVHCEFRGRKKNSRIALAKLRIDRPLEPSEHPLVNALMKSCDDEHAIVDKATGVHFQLRLVVRDLSKEATRRGVISGLVGKAFKPKCSRVVDLSALNLRDEEIHIILQYVEADKREEMELDLSKNRLTDKGVNQIINFLKNDRKLQRIKISGGAVSILCRERLEGHLATNFLQSSSVELKDLRSLNRRNLGDAGTCILCSELLDTMRDTSKITFLGLAKANIGPTGATALVKVLKEAHICMNLRVLELYGNSPEANWAILFASVIRQGRKNLASVDLGSNGIDDNGARELAKALTEKSCVLEELHLDFNKISMDGFPELKKSAKAASRLHTLWLHGNEISHQDLTVLQKMLDAKRRLIRPRPSLQHIGRDVQKRISAPLDPRKNFWCVSSEADEIAKLCLRAYETLCPMLQKNVQGKIVFACILEEEPERTSVIALGVGTRILDGFLSGSDVEGDRVKDSHAEVLARRAFNRYLIRRKFLDAKNSSYRYHLFTSTCPCGAASETGTDPRSIFGKGGGYSASVLEEGMRKSCTDKIRRWLEQGLQRKDMVQLVGRVPLQRIIIAERWSEQCLAVFPKSAERVSQSLVNDHFTIRQGNDSSGDSDTCVFWSAGDDEASLFDGKTGLTIENETPSISPWRLKQDVEIALKCVF